MSVFCEVLPWDSEFFGLKIARFDGVFPLEEPFQGRDLDFSAALQELESACRSAGVQYLFGQINPKDLATLRALGEAGFRLVETRAYYHRSLLDFEPMERYACRLATPGDVEPLARTAREMVNHFDRFHADPLLPKERVDSFMERWVEASINSNFADLTIVPDVETPTAFCTAKLRKDEWSASKLNVSQPVFSAVGPEFRGWYKKIISELSFYLRGEGAEHAFMATQVTNGAVLHCWEKLGYRFGKAEHVFAKEIS